MHKTEELLAQLQAEFQRGCDGPTSTRRPLKWIGNRPEPFRLLCMNRKVKISFVPLHAEFQDGNSLANSAINYSRLQFFGHFADVTGVNMS